MDNMFLTENQTDMSHFLRLDGTIRGGFCWEERTRLRWRDLKSVERYGYKVYSQNEEDGIIQEIFRRIGTTNKKFIEFGVTDGLECNTHFLLFKEWTGLWIEGSSQFVEQIHIKFKPVIQCGQLKIKNAFITKDNINNIIEGEGVDGEIDLLSIDIDGNDYYIWETIEVVKPRVVVIEYNGKFPPDVDWKMAYNAKHVWDGSDWQGASLKALELLGRRLGYQLVGTNLTGANAFFVKEELADGKFITPATAENLYNVHRAGLVFITIHPSRYCLKGQQEELGILNYFNHEPRLEKKYWSNLFRKGLSKLRNALVKRLKF